MDGVLTDTLIFEELVKENRERFIARVREVSAFLMLPSPNWLMFVMWFETNHTMDHRIRNRIGATGLIQFTPDTAIYLGTTVEKLRLMSNVEQMDYVQKHLAPYRGKYNSFVDLYLAIFWPAGVGKPDDYTITRDKVAQQNPIFDRNKDLDITKLEIKQTLMEQIPERYKHLFN